MKKSSKTVLIAVVLMMLSFSFAPDRMGLANTQSTQATKNTLIIAINSPLKDHNPVISNSAYDQYALSSVYLPLLILSTPNGDPTFTKWQAYPMLAATWNHSTDRNQLTWFVTLKTGLTWQDGQPLNASDVKFTFDAILDPATNNPASATYMDLFNNTYYNSTLLSDVQAHAVQIVNATTLKIQFARYDPYQLEDIGIVPVPMHQLMNVLHKNWQTDITDTGTKITNASATLTGDGPYMFMNMSSDGSSGYLQAWSGWNAAYASKFSDSPFGVVPSIKNVIITVNADPTNAVTALKTGQIDWIDSQTGLAPVFSQITSPAVAVTYQAYGFQEMGLNMRNDIFGANPADPAANYNISSSSYQQQVYCADAQCSTTSTSIASPYMSTAWQLQEQYNSHQGTNQEEYFYKALNATGRLLIRQAFDYSIARQAIINSLLQGHGYLLNGRLLPQTGYVNTSIGVRPYNLTIAANLMASVFGYKYNPNCDPSKAAGASGACVQLNGVDVSIPYFTVTFAVPNNNANRVQWASRIAAAVTSIGVDVTTKTFTFPQALNRIFYTPVQGADGKGGVDYAHGGFDVYFAGWGATPLANEAPFYQSNQFAPLGQNYQYINDPYMDTIMKNEVGTNQALRTAAYNQEQQYVYWNATDSSIEQDQDIYAVSNTVRGFNPFLGYSPMLNNVSFTAGGTVTTTTTTTTSSGPSGTSSTSSTTNSPFGDIFVILGAIGAGSAVLVFSRRRKLN